jgi:alpha-tubulin suppressor-like RCC1 family protein
VSIHTSCSGCHFVALDLDGNAWLFGRNGSAALGVPDVEYLSENAPRMVRPSDLGASTDVQFVEAACGRNHTLLVGSDGSLWTSGANNLGQVRIITANTCAAFLDFSVSVWSSHMP